VPARLLPGHHRLPREQRIKVASRREQPRREALADQAALRVATEGAEAVPDHRRAVAARICRDGDDARRQAASGQGRICEARDRQGVLTDVDDSHRPNGTP
jgi:hypothetical protein